MNNQNIWVILETADGAPKRVSLELLGKAKETVSGLKEKVTAVLIDNYSGEGENSDKTEAAILAAAFASGADEAIVVRRKTCFEGEAYIIDKLIGKYSPRAVLIGSTSRGSDLAGALSARSGIGIAVNCTDMIPVDGGILWIRPSNDGKLNASIRIDSFPQIGTFHAGTLPEPEQQPGRTGTVIYEDIEVPDSVLLTNFLGFIPDDELMKTDIENADILISGGRGVGSKEGFGQLFELAQLIGGNVAGSRAAVDEGWIEKERQVGITGKTVAPRLYIALGISGQTPHIAGMKESDVIVAVNTDAGAPIFEVADYSLVADLHEIVPEMIRKFKELKA